MNSSYILILIYILDGMILKMNKFVIQLRKFEFKRNYIVKDMDFSISWIFPKFILILIPLKMVKRGFISPLNPRS